MSKAKPGDGKMREKVKEAGARLLAAAIAYDELVQMDAAHTKRHMSYEIADEQWLLLEKVREMARVSYCTMAEAKDHHGAQTSVLSNNLFGQRRRIKAGKVVTIDKVDPVKLADTMNRYGWTDLTAKEQATFMSRAANPKAGFYDLTEEGKKDYLSGKTE